MNLADDGLVVYPLLDLEYRRHYLGGLVPVEEKTPLAIHETREPSAPRGINVEIDEEFEICFHHSMSMEMNRPFRAWV